MSSQYIKNAVRNNYFIDPKYTIRSKPEYFQVEDSDVIWQPNVYSLAFFLGEKLGCKYIVDIGCGAGEKLVQMHPTFKLVGIDYGINLIHCRKKYPFGTWMEHNLDTHTEIILSDEVLKNSIIICADVIEHLVNPGYLAWNLKRLLNLAPVCLVSTPERELTYRYDHMGPPKNKCHVREWTSNEFRKFLISFQFNLKHLGLTVSNNKLLRKETILAVLGNNNNDCKGFDKLISQTEIENQM